MSHDSLAHLASANAADVTDAAAAAIANARAGIEAAKNGNAPDIDVLDRFDEAIAALSNVANMSSLIGRSHPDATMREAADAAMELLSAELTAISLDPDLYAVLAEIDVTGEDAPTQHFLAKTLRDFRRAGVDQDEVTRVRVRELQDEIVAIGLAFGRNIQEDTRTGRFPVSALDGLPADFVRAHQPDEHEMVSITTEYPDIRPFLTYSTDAAAREQMWRLNRLRAYPANVEVLNNLIARRHELATLLGYESWAAYVTEDKMIGTDTAVAEFIEKISAASGTRADADYAALLALKQRDEPASDRVYPWDQSFLSDRLKSETLAFDTQAVRPYFEYTRVKVGLMALVERMFGITFRRTTDTPVWHPEVEVYEVVWTDGGAPVGRIFLDMHPRANKYNHAAMFGMQTGKPAKGRLPECALLCNLPAPGDEPALLQHSDVTTFFHEFGHLIHHLIGGHQRWDYVSGISTERDFIEAPSQLLEEWTVDAGTLASFAVHHETGEPLPAEMVAKLRAADEFGKGLGVRQQMHYATLSLELYRRDPKGLDPDAVDREATERHTPFAYVEDGHWPLSFGHLVGYSAVYYTYMWSLVIAKDLFTRFAAEGLPAPEASVAYRDAVLAPGGSAPAADLVRAFLGRDYTFDAYRVWLDAD